MADRSNNQYRIAVLVSGGGTNLQAIIDAAGSGKLPVQIAVVVSNREDAFAITRAKRAEIPTLLVDHRQYRDRDSYDQALISGLASFRADLIVLAGFMRILTPAFVDQFRGRILNIHPALLPKFTGLDTYRRALDAGDDVHGTSIHFVTEKLDGGPVIMQARVPVQDNDDEQSLSARVQACEHIIYPRAIAWCANGRLVMSDHGVLLDGKPLSSPVVYEHEELMNI